MRYELLNRTHGNFQPELLDLHRDLFCGGRAFRDHIGRYLLKNDNEKPDVYSKRCQRAYYIGYVSQIVNLFCSWLFTRPPTVSYPEGSEAEFWQHFVRDCDGERTSLELFARGMLRDAFVDRVSYAHVWIDPSGSETLDEYERIPDRVRVVKIPACQVRNWKRDASGALEWALVHRVYCEAESFLDESDTVVERWDLFSEKEGNRAWETRYPAGKPPSPKAEIPETEPLTGTLVSLELPDEFWLMNLLSGPQLEHFRKDNALSWSIERTCYSMPVFRLKSREHPPVMGAGYYLIIGEGEDVIFPAPPTQPYDVISNRVDRLREELHRVTAQLAVSYDSSSAAISRAAESKAADNAITAKVLEALGAFVLRFLRRTIAAVAKLAGGLQAPTVEGMEGYDVSTLDTINNALDSVEKHGIPSVTLTKALQKRLASHLLSDEKPETVSQAVTEIEAPPEVSKPVDKQTFSYELELGLYTINESRTLKGFGPLLLASGAPDPDGNLTLPQLKSLYPERYGGAKPAEPQ